MNGTSLLVFNLGVHRCALDTRGVEEVIRIVYVTPIPDTELERDFTSHLDKTIEQVVEKRKLKVDGVVNLRGVLIPVVDLRKSLGLEPGPVKMQNRIIVTSNRKGRTGFIVDEVCGVVDVGGVSEASRLSNPLGKNVSWLSRIENIEGKLVNILDFSIFQEILQSEYPEPLLKVQRKAQEG
jgi:purine-binding chemotaxis protein CheW